MSAPNFDLSIHENVTLNDLERKMEQISKISKEIDLLASFDVTKKNTKENFGTHFNDQSFSLDDNLDDEFSAGPESQFDDDNIDHDKYWDNYHQFFEKLNSAKNDIKQFKKMVPEFIGDGMDLSDDELNTAINNIQSLNNKLDKNINQINTAYKTYSNVDNKYIDV
ncbi:uncharacterized protein ASCRUDRAFT_78092 [Ascoidea rubescens DSM 1968]|uniref:Uncharacterized protein n=1 Tax=Ascoidea rubescens DSM 1968 TaxID=1344418 RepID=A0A1D2V9J1_9ASCO|nr:hypothetical protein ASCRUDRAFT_78092 [Ascoidea rubescens DSM 1968]ODV58185.1 hypothetical protein ASCRUDRAFT_78092 [Ascoidea rubescens DSM 1968]